MTLVSRGGYPHRPVAQPADTYLYHIFIEFVDSLGTPKIGNPPFIGGVRVIIGCISHKATADSFIPGSAASHNDNE
jgi:hypothetical protein